jgi:hypothetical protein
MSKKKPSRVETEYLVYCQEGKHTKAIEWLMKALNISLAEAEEKHEGWQEAIREASKKRPVQKAEAPKAKADERKGRVITLSELVKTLTDAGYSHAGQKQDGTWAYLKEGQIDEFLKTEGKRWSLGAAASRQ